MPGTIPSANKLVNGPAGSVSLTQPLISANKPSIKSIGTDAQVKIAWKIRSKIPMKMA